MKEKQLQRRKGGRTLIQAGQWKHSPADNNNNNGKRTDTNKNRQKRNRKMWKKGSEWAGLSEKQETRVGGNGLALLWKLGAIS